MTRTTTCATTCTRQNAENPPRDIPQPSENFTQVNLPGSDNTQHQNTTEGPMGTLEKALISMIR